MHRVFEQNMDTKELKERQSWTLEQKIDHSLGVIDQFVSRLDGKVYVGFSGGKDSTVLLDLCRIIKPDIKAVFCNTGNEYPDIVRFVRGLKDTDGYNIEIIYPKMKPQEVFEKYGFPLEIITEPKILQLPHGYMKGNVQHISPAITTSSWEANNVLIEPTLKIKQATKKGYAECEPGGIFDGSYPNSKTRRGRVQERGKISPALTSQGEPLNVFEESYRIRKLTERECFRLMGVDDEDIDKIQQSNLCRTSQYKIAGNSIVVDVLYYIFKNLFIEKQEFRTPVQLSLF